jgi:hypothetical protein
LIEAAAAFLAWLGASLVLLSDGRRGLALGLGVLTIGLAVLAWPAGMPFGAIAVAAGGLVAATRSWRTGPAAWGIMPAGSTPRLLLCVASGLVALWVAALVTGGTGASLRFAALVVLGLMGARILMSRDPASTVTAIASFALALGVAPGLAATSQGPFPEIVGALVAAGVVFVPAGRVATTPQASAGEDGA